MVTNANRFLTSQRYYALVGARESDGEDGERTHTGRGRRADILELVEYNLPKEGYAVTCVASGEEALRRCAPGCRTWSSWT